MNVQLINIFFGFVFQWMYIVPLVIFMLLPSVTNQESGGGTAPQRWCFTLMNLSILLTVEISKA